jgi:DNA-binding HxlR family transcriptional regulator
MAKRMTIQECPVKYTADVIGGKWKPMILYYLKSGPQRYGELKRQVVGISKKVLTQQIRELERDEIVARKVYPGNSPHVEYTLSAHGETLRGVLEVMAEWGAAHRARRSGHQKVPT